MSNTNNNNNNNTSSSNAMAQSSTSTNLEKSTTKQRSVEDNGQTTHIPQQPVS